MSLPANKANEIISELIQQSGAEVGLAARQVATGKEILIRPDQSFHPASIIKVCVMIEVFRQAQQGLFSLDDPMLVKNEFVSIADGSSYSLSVVDDSGKGFI